VHAPFNFASKGVDVFSGLPGGSVSGGQVRSWLYVAFVAVVAIVVVFGLVKLLFYATDSIQATPPKPMTI
jgi:hypothetical protein